MGTAKQTHISTSKLALEEDLIFWIVICSFLTTWKEHGMNIFSKDSWTFAFLCLEFLVSLEVSLGSKAQQYKSYWEKRPGGKEQKKAFFLQRFPFFIVYGMNCSRKALSILAPLNYMFNGEFRKWLGLPIEKILALYT